MGIYYINAPSEASVHPPEAVEFPCDIYIRSGAKTLAWEFDTLTIMKEKEVLQGGKRL